MSTLAPSLPSDRQLLDAVRRGNDAAWNELMARHLAALRALLRGRRERRTFDDALGDLRERLVCTPDDHQGDAVVRSFRPKVLAAVFGGAYGPSGHERTDGAETLATAFGRLPEPWQTVLWHRAVEGLDDARTAPLVGRPVCEVGPLLDTARRGLAHAFLVECDGRVPPGADVEPLAAVIDHHLAAVIVPRLSGHTVGDHRRVAACRPRRRRLSTRMI